MKSVLFKKYGQDLAMAYKNQPVEVRRTSTCTLVEYVYYGEYSGEYNIHAYGQNRNGVYFMAQLVNYRGEKHFYFQYCSSEAEKIAKFCLNNLENTDKLQKVVYCSSLILSDIIAELEKAA